MADFSVVYPFGGSGGGGGGVTTINGETGDINIIGGTGITVTPSGQNITITNTGAGSGTVTDVTATAPLASSGGATPDISLTGIVPIANGGTGQSTANSALNALLPSQISGNVLSTDGTNTSWEDPTSLILGSPNTFAGFDNSGHLYSTPWGVDANGQATGTLTGTQPIDNVNMLEIFPTISAPLSNGFEGIIVNPTLSSTMSFASMYNAEVTFSSGYNNSGGIGIYQDQSNLNSGSSTGNYYSFGSFPQIHGSVTNFGNYTAGASIDSSTLTVLNSFGTFNQFTSGYANSGGTIGFSDANNMASGTSTSYYSSAQFSPAFASGSTIGGVQGISISPSMQGTNTGSYTAIQINGTSSAPIGGNANGITINLSGVTDSNPQGVVGISSDSRLQINASTILESAQTFQIGTRIEHAYTIAPGSPVTGTDSLGLNLAGDLIAQDNIALGPVGIGFVSVGFIADMAVAVGKTVDKISAFLPAVSLPSPGFTTGGNVTEMNMIHMVAPFSQGGTIAITNLYGLHLDDTTFGPFAALATNAWGLYIEGSSLKSHIAGILDVGSLVLDGSTSGTLTLNAAATTTSYSVIMPSAQGAASTVLTNDGSGILSWSAGSGSSITIGAIDSQAANANGLSLVSSVLSTQSADATHPGMVNNTTQSFSGNKTFTGTISASNLSGTNTGDVTIGAPVGATANGATITGQVLALAAADATHPGILSFGAQGIGGLKTFSSGIISPFYSSNAGQPANSGELRFGNADTINWRNAANSANIGLTLDSSNIFQLGSQLNVAGALRSNTSLILEDPGAGTNIVTIKSPTLAASYTLTLPVDDGTPSQFLQTDGSGVLTWASASVTSGNLTDVGTDGIVITGGTGAVLGAGTSIAQTASDATHNGYLSSTDWSTFNAKQSAGNYITALTGDATATGPGSVALTLATVNGNVGSFGSSTSIPSFTVNAKGLITAASGNVVIAPAGTLTGTTLNSTVVTSSLTSVGTITSGTWNGTTIAIANGGTGQTTASAAFNALSPMTTGGDLIYGGASGAGTRLANGTAGQVLQSNGTTLAPTWVTPTSGITQLTGDATAGPGSGSQAITFATVNANVGSFGSSTSIPNFTVNAKGLLTAAGSNVVIAPAGTLSGTTLNSTVVSSSLTSVGTITSGTWNGTTIAIANGGTGQTTASAAFNALSPVTTTGDMIYSASGATNSRLPVGTTGQYLSVAAGVPTWTSVTPGVPNSEVWVDTGLSQGATNTNIRTFLNNPKTVGTDITYTSSATLGDSFTVNANGIYSISYSDVQYGAPNGWGLSLNSTNLSTSIGSIPAAERIQMTYFDMSAIGPTTNAVGNVSATLHLNSGDVVRAHIVSALSASVTTAKLIFTRIA